MARGLRNDLSRSLNPVGRYTGLGPGLRSPEAAVGQGALMPISVDEFRRVMSRWTSGITVVTAAYQGQTHGMVASSFSSVSADPVSVLFCADHGTRTYPLVRDSGAFAVNILAQDQ